MISLIPVTSLQKNKMLLIKSRAFRLQSNGIYQSADKTAIDFIIIGSVILSTSFCILYLKLTFYHKSKHMSSIDLKVLKKLWVLSRDAAKNDFFPKSK